LLDAHHFAVGAGGIAQDRIDLGNIADHLHRQNRIGDPTHRARRVRKGWPAGEKSDHRHVEHGNGADPALQFSFCHGIIIVKGQGHFTQRRKARKGGNLSFFLGELCAFA